MIAFSEVIRQWETFYLLAGTASVTLIGLLFISVSINVERFHGRKSADLKHFAGLTFNCFFYVLIIAILFLVPGISSLGLGIPLFILGILGILNAIVQQRRAQRSTKNGTELNIAPRFNVPIIGLALMILLSVGIYFQIETSLYGFIIVIILLLGSASHNAWAMLVEIRK